MDSKDRQVATYIQKRRMEVLMLEHSSPIEGTPERRWHTGWSHYDVGNEVHLTPQHSRRLAREAGLVILPAAPPPTTEERLTTLEMQFRDTMSALKQFDIVLTELVRVVMGGPSEGETEEWQRSFGDGERGGPELVGVPEQVQPDSLYDSLAGPLPEGSNPGASEAGAPSVARETGKLRADLEAGRRDRLLKRPEEAGENIEGD